MSSGALIETQLGLTERHEMLPRLLGNFDLPVASHGQISVSLFLDFTPMATEVITIISGGFPVLVISKDEWKGPWLETRPFGQFYTDDEEILVAYAYLMHALKVFTAAEFEYWLRHPSHDSFSKMQETSDEHVTGLEQLLTLAAIRAGWGERGE